MTWLREMLEYKYIAFRREPSSVDLFIEQSLKDVRIAPMEMVHSRYRRILAYAMGHIWNQSCTENIMSSLMSTLRKYERMLVEMFDKHYDTSIYTLYYYSLGYIVTDKTWPRTPSLFDSST